MLTEYIHGVLKMINIDIYIYIYIINCLNLSVLYCILIKIDKKSILFIEN